MNTWGGRFVKDTNEIMKKFNNSLVIDKRLYKEDILSGIAHTKMLSHCNIITSEEKDIIVNELNKMLEEINSGSLIVDGSFEDIHSFVEMTLISRIGDLGKKLHTARSRNDLVATDVKMYIKNISSYIIESIEELQNTLEKVGLENDVLMPGYTHLQRAQVVTFKHYLMSYFNMLNRDKKRILNAIDIMNESPLGCCALAGTTYSIDREYTSFELGFKKPVDNFLDGVSDRDFIIELLSAFSIIMMHLSRLSEEIIIFSSKEFDFITLGDEFATGSSIMPQKKNPDGAELIRGKTGAVYGNLMCILTVMKGIPLSYNKDMQEDKTAFFNSLDTVIDCISIMNGIISTLTVNKDNMLKSIKYGFLNATEVADYLVNKGMPFRDAHKVSGNIVLYCEEKKICIEDISLKKLKEFSNLFEDDIYDFIDYNNILHKGIKNIML